MLEYLVKYTELADRTVINTILSASVSLPRAEELFSHILNAQHIWLCRIQGVLPGFEVFTLHEKNDFELLHLRNINALKSVMLPDRLESSITYTNFRGDTFTDVVQDILFQLLNHSTYHRGQIATELRVNGINPPLTDYIHFKRQGLL